MRRRSRPVIWLLVGVLGILMLAVAGLWTAPRWLVPRIAAGSPRCLYSVPTHEPVVALTLDDGPDAASTARILDVLREHDAHATFFLIGERVRGNEALVARMVADGHELGNHLTRDEPSIQLEPEAFEAAALETGTVLSRFGPVRWLRPGSAWYNDEMLVSIDRLGYRCALGSVYPFDPHIRSARIASAYILANIAPGAVIVLHEGGARGPRTAETLGRLLPLLHQRGFRVVTLSELERARR